MCSELGHGDVVCLATRRVPRSRCVRPISASQHSTYEYPYSPAPGSSSSAVTRRACTRWVAPTVTEAPSVSRRSFVRFGGSPEPVGSFRPDRVGLRLPRFCPRTRIWLFSYAICGDRPSDTPVASSARPAHFLLFRPLSRRCAIRRRPPDRFPSGRRDANRRFHDPRCLPSASASRLLLIRYRSRP